MAAPKNPNPGPGAAKRRQQGIETLARKLREAGWEPVPPELAEEVREFLKNSGLRGTR